MGENMRTHGKWYALLSFLLLAAIVFGIYKDTKADEYANEIKMDYQRCFTELVQYVDDLNLSLEKSKFVNDPKQMMRISGEIYRQASSAAANLALLPLKSEPLEHVSEFLNQVGNYSHNLSFKMLEGENITEDEYKKLSELSGYAVILAQSLDKNLEDLYNGTLDIRRTAEGADVSGIDKVMGEIEAQLHDYPALIYDGPFSSHLTDRKPLFLEGKSEITKEEAYEKAKIISGQDELECVEEDGNIPVFFLYNNDGQYSVCITKKGGYVLSYLNDRDVADATINIADAKILATTFLENMGFGEVKESYYETISNVAVINYAAVQEGYTLYPDLIKVKVALDTGEIVGCESRGYVMYHHERDIPPMKISAEEAKAKVNPHVEILSTSLTLIPQDGGSEDYCWQIEGKIGDRRCLIYVNTQNGAEEKLFILIESETGVLAA